MSNPFEIKQHRLHENRSLVSFKKSPNQSGNFAPEGIILHDTAGRLDEHSSVNWFMNPDARASAHFTIERDGSLTQQVALNRRAWHAGKSRYKGRNGVNAFAFGIEIVNLGKCSQLSDGRIKPWFNAHYRDGVDGLDFEKISTPQHGSGWWLTYTEAQITTLIHLCQALVKKYDLAFITTHWDISPGRKVDTNPLFPLEEVREAVFGNGDGQDEGLTGSRVIADANLRRWPSYNDNIIEVVPKGSKVDIIRSGHYQHEQNAPELWYLIEHGSQQGWMHGSLIEL